MKTLNPKIKVAYKIIAFADFRAMGYRDRIKLLCEDSIGLEVEIEINPRELGNKEPLEKLTKVGKWFVVTQEGDKIIAAEGAKIYVDAEPIEKDKIISETILLKDKLTDVVVASMQRKERGPKDYDLQDTYLQAIIELNKVIRLNKTDGK